MHKVFIYMHKVFIFRLIVAIVECQQVALDLEIRINGKRLKQGPFATNIRPARLSADLSQVYGDGTKGAVPGEEKVCMCIVSIFLRVFVCVYVSVWY
jgi:hypothetical protein